MSLSDSDYFAVIDTETNFDDEVISIGVVVSESSFFVPVEKLYLILTPEYKKPAMFSYALNHSGATVDALASRKEAIMRVKQLLSDYCIDSLFAYNAGFDKGHLPEMSGYCWYDIMKLAAYRQFNHSIPSCCDCYSTGRMKCGYGAEEIYRMLSGERRYNEIHNALTDAEDELEIMRLLGHGIEKYDVAHL